MSKTHVFLCCSALIAFVSCAKNQQPADTGARLEAKRQAIFVKFASDQHAILEWKATLPFHSATGAFSVQVQDALIRPDKQPVAFRATLHDVVRRGNNVFFEFDDSDGLFFTLEATPASVEQVLKEEIIPGLGEYAVTAEIEGCHKVSFQVAPDPEGGAPEVAEISASDKFVARGRCVGLMRLPDE